MSDLLIRGGTLVTEHGTRAADLRVGEGKIADIFEGNAAPPDRGGSPSASGDSIIDARGQLVMPGGIDSHVHLEHPIDRLGLMTVDDFFSGTVAAACGGVTTVIDFALQRRGETLRAAVEQRLRQARRKAAIDYGLHVIVTDVRNDVLAEVPVLVADGFTSFKVYMTYADKVVRDDGLLRLLATTGDSGALAYLHCENDCAVNHLSQGFLGAGDTGPEFHPHSRPPMVEGEATNRALMLGELVGAPMCIAHVTSTDALRHVAEARGRGAPVVSETCPQYLVLTAEEYAPERGFEAAKFVCSPPLRAAEHREALWSGLARGEIQQVASDHAPFNYVHHKRQGRRDFTQIPNGLPGIETRVPLLFSEGVGKGRLSLEQFVSLISTQPARIFGLYPQKGSLEPGADADLILIDPEREVVVDYERLHSDLDYSPYQGMRLRGVPTLTISRGEIVSVDGRVARSDAGDARNIAEEIRGRGRLLRRRPCEASALP